MAWVVLLLAVTACSDSDAVDQPTEDAGAPAETEADADDGPSAAGLDLGTITTIVGYDAGGSYDDAARWLQPRLEEATGATNVVENVPGAGNLIALNQLWVADPDGATIGTVNGPGTVVTLLTDSAEAGIEFELTEFSYLAGLTSEPRLMTVGADSPYESFDDMLAADATITFGVTGTSGAGYNDAVFMQGVFGDQIDSQIVTGFESGAETQLALIRGEVDAAFNLLGGELSAIEAGDIRGLVVLSDERSDALPDVPAITEFELSEEALELLETHITIAELGIILAAPPDVDEDTLAALRAAVEAAANDPGLIEEAQAAGVNWAPRSGDEVHAAISAALDAPPRYVELMVDALSGS